MPKTDTDYTISQCLQGTSLDARNIDAELKEIVNCWEQIKQNRKKQPRRGLSHSTLWGHSTTIDHVEQTGDAFVQFLKRKTIAENGYAAIRQAFENVLKNSPIQCNMKEFKLNSKQLRAYALEPGMPWYVMYLLSVFLTPAVSITLFCLFLHMPGLAMIGLALLATVCMVAVTVCAGFAEQWRYAHYSNKFLTAIKDEMETLPAVVAAGDSLTCEDRDLSQSTP